MTRGVIIVFVKYTDNIHKATLTHISPKTKTHSVQSKKTVNTLLIRQVESNRVSQGCFPKINTRRKFLYTAIKFQRLFMEGKCFFKITSADVLGIKMIQITISKKERKKAFFRTRCRGPDKSFTFLLCLSYFYYRPIDTGTTVMII